MVKGKIRFLTLTGRLMIAKCILLFQYIYMFQSLEIKNTMLEKIRMQLDNFILGHMDKKCQRKGRL